MGRSSIFKSIIPSIVGPIIAGVVIAYSYGIIKNPFVFRKEPITEIVVEEPVINLNDSFRTISYQNERDGLVTLIQLSRTSDMEDSWLYSHCEETWHEAGIVSNEYSTKINFDYWSYVVDRCDSIGDYHNHNDEDWERRLGGLQLIGLPSGTDLAAMVERNKGFRKKYPDGNYVSGIVSPLGVVEITLTDEGYQYFKDLSPFVVKPLTERIYIDVGMTAIENEGSFEEDIEVGCEILEREGYFGCRFIPASDIITPLSRTHSFQSLY